MTDVTFPLSDVVIPEGAFASLPTPTIGTVYIILDSRTNIWGANISGGGRYKVFAWYNGSNWTVVGR